MQVLETQNFIKFFKVPRECDNFFFITIMMKMKVIRIYFNQHLSSKMCIVGRGILTSLFYEDPPVLLIPSFQLFSNPPIPSLLPPTPTPTALSVVLYFWLNGWSYHIWCAILLNDIMNLMLSLGILVPEGPWCVFYVTRHQMYWGLTHNAVFCWYSDLISHTKRHTTTHSTFRGQ